MRAFRARPLPASLDSKAVALAVAAVLAVTLLAAGCNRPHAADVLATVNGRPIQDAELEKYYKARLGESEQEPNKVLGDTLKLQILRGLIDDEILQQRAAKLNLVATDEEVEAKLTELKAPFTQEEFDKRLKAQSVTLDDVKRNFRRSLTTDKLLNKEIYSKINITDTDISNYYNLHKAEYNLVEPQYRLSQILVTSSPGPQQAGNLQNSKATSEADAKKKIDLLHNRLSSGEDFGAVAMNFSEEPNTASSGGDMGFVSETQMHSDPAVYAAINRLNPGQITDVLPIMDPATRRTMGYAIYKLISKEPPGQRELNDPRVQQAIRQQLRDSRAQLLKNAYYEMLRDQSRVENYFAEQIYKTQLQ